MPMKTVLVAATALGIAGPAFAQDQIRVTPQQCINAGGEIDQALNICRIADGSELAALQQNAGLGAGVGAGGAAAAGLLLVLAVAGGSSGGSTTTTTTTTTGG